MNLLVSAALIGDTQGSASVKKTSVRFALAAALAATLGIAGIGSAQAATGCTKGFACLWENINYNASGTAKEWGNSVNAGTYSPFSTVTGYRDIASSAWANGGQCRYTYWYVDPSQSGDYFYLNSQTAVGSGYKDSYLGDGAGFGPHATKNFNDNISSFQFSGC
ncbi:hypothetical protein [Sanguibacter suarezii]|uniref:hypothetical protein n=1 Tax=Sanguibacter suarezii TaxID=60921 RepID=UPI0012FC4A20|nr:hypothetical protein [Sanguibacter suarezii]